MATEKSYQIKNFELETKIKPEDEKQKPLDEDGNMIMNPMRKAAHQSYSKFKPSPIKSKKRESVKIVQDDGTEIEMIPVTHDEWEEREKEFIRRESVLLQNIQAVHEDNKLKLQQTHKHHAETHMNAIEKHKKVVAASVFVIFALIVVTIILAVTNNVQVIQQIIGGDGGSDQSDNEPNSTVIIIDNTIKSYNIIANELKQALLETSTYDGKRNRRLRILSGMITLKTHTPLLLPEKTVDSIVNSALEEMKKVKNENICDLVMAGITGSFSTFDQINLADDEKTQRVLARIATSFVNSTESRNLPKYVLDCSPEQYLKYTTEVVTDKVANFNDIVQTIASVIGRQNIVKSFQNMEKRVGAFELISESLGGRLQDQNLISPVTKGLLSGIIKNRNNFPNELDITNVITTFGKGLTRGATYKLAAQSNSDLNSILILSSALSESLSMLPILTDQNLLDTTKKVLSSMIQGIIIKMDASGNNNINEVALGKYGEIICQQMARHAISYRPSATVTFQNGAKVFASIAAGAFEGLKVTTSADTVNYNNPDVVASHLMAGLVGGVFNNINTINNINESALFVPPMMLETGYGVSEIISVNEGFWMKPIIISTIQTALNEIDKYDSNNNDLNVLNGEKKSTLYANILKRLPHGFIHGVGKKSNTEFAIKDIISLIANPVINGAIATYKSLPLTFLSIDELIFILSQGSTNGVIDTSKEATRGSNMLSDGFEQLGSQLVNGLGVNGSTAKNVEAISKGISSQVGRLNTNNNRRRRRLKNNGAMIASSTIIKLIASASQGAVLSIMNASSYTSSANNNMDNVESLISSMTSGFIEGTTINSTTAPSLETNDVLYCLKVVGDKILDSIVSNPFNVVTLPPISTLIVEVAGGSTKGLAAAAKVIPASKLLQGIQTISSAIVEKTINMTSSVNLENLLDKLGGKMANEFETILTRKSDDPSISKESLFQEACSGAMGAISNAATTMSTSLVTSSISKIAGSFSKAIVELNLTTTGSTFGANTTTVDELNQVLSTLSFTITSFIPSIISKNSNVSVSNLMEATTETMTKTLASSDVNSSSIMSIISNLCGSAVSGIKSATLLSESVFAAQKGCRDGVKYVSTAKNLPVSFETDADKNIINSVVKVAKDTAAAGNFTLNETTLVTNVCAATGDDTPIVEDSSSVEKTKIAGTIVFNSEPSVVVKTMTIDSLSIIIPQLQIFSGDSLTLNFSTALFTNTYNGECSIYIGANNTYTVNAYDNIITVSGANSANGENIQFKCSGNLIQSNDIGNVYVNILSETTGVNQTSLKVIEVVPNQIISLENFRFLDSYVSSYNGGDMEFEFTPRLTLMKDDFINLTAISRDIFNRSSSGEPQICAIRKKPDGSVVSVIESTIESATNSLIIKVNDTVQSFISYKVVCDSSFIQNHGDAGIVMLTLMTNKDTIVSPYINYTIEPNEVIINSIQQSNDGDKYALGNTGSIIFKITPRTTLLGGDQIYVESNQVLFKTKTLSKSICSDGSDLKVYVDTSSKTLRLYLPDPTDLSAQADLSRDTSNTPSSYPAYTTYEFKCSGVSVLNQLSEGWASFNVTTSKNVEKQTNMNYNAFFIYPNKVTFTSVSRSLGYFEGLSGGNLILDFQNKLELLEENNHAIIITATPNVFLNSTSTSCTLYVTKPIIRTINLQSSIVTDSTLKIILAQDLNGDSNCKLECSDNILLNGENGATGNISFAMTTSRDTVVSTAQYATIRNSFREATLQWINGTMTSGVDPGALILSFTITRALSQDNYIYVEASQDIFNDGITITGDTCTLITNMTNIPISLEQVTTKNVSVKLTSNSLDTTNVPLKFTLTCVSAFITSNGPAGNVEVNIWSTSNTQKLLSPLTYSIVSNSVKNVSIFRTGSTLAYGNIGNLEISFNLFKALSIDNNITIASTEYIFLDDITVNYTTNRCNLYNSNNALLSSKFAISSRSKFYFTISSDLYAGLGLKIICTTGLEKNPSATGNVTYQIVTTSNFQAAEFSYGVFSYARIISIYRSKSTVSNALPGSLVVLFQITSALNVGSNVTLYVPNAMSIYSPFLNSTNEMQCTLSLSNETGTSSLKSQWSLENKMLHVQVEKAFTQQSQMLLSCPDSYNLASNPVASSVNNVTFVITTSTDVEMDTPNFYYIASDASTIVLQVQLSTSYISGTAPGNLIIRYRISQSLSYTNVDYIDMTFTKQMFSSVGIVNNNMCTTSRVDTGNAMTLHNEINILSTMSIRLNVSENMYAGLEYETTCTQNLAINDAVPGDNLILLKSSKDTVENYGIAYTLQAYAVQNLNIVPKITVADMEPEEIVITFKPTVKISLNDEVTIDFFDGITNASISMFDENNGQIICKVTGTTTNMTVQSKTDSSIVLLSIAAYDAGSDVSITCTDGLKPNALPDNVVGIKLKTTTNTIYNTLSTGYKILPNAAILHSLKRDNYVANGLSEFLEIEFTPLVYKTDRTNNCLYNCTKAFRENDQINISLFYQSNLSNTNTPFAMGYDNGIVSACTMWEVNSKENVTLLNAVVISSTLLSLTINDTVNPSTRLGIRCESATYFGRNPLYVSNVYGSITTSQDTTSSNQLVYSVLENKLIFNNVNRHVLCTTLNPGNLTFSFKITSPIDNGDNITLNSNSLDQIFEDGSPSSNTTAQISCDLYTASDKAFIPVLYQEKDSSKFVYKVLQHVPSNTELLFECYGEETFKANGDIDSTVAFDLSTTQDFRTSMTKNYTIIPNQVVFEHYKSGNSYYTNSPPPAGAMFLKFRILLELVAGDLINVVSNEKIFLQHTGYVQTKCGISSKTTDFLVGNSNYAFDTLTSNQNMLQLKVRSEQINIHGSSFGKDADLEVVCYNKLLYVDPLPDKATSILFNISTNKNIHPVQINVFSVILNQPHIYNIERTGSYFARQDPQSLIMTFELKTDLQENKFLDIYSTGSNNLFVSKADNSLSYELTCSGVTGIINIKHHTIVSQHHLQLQAGVKINRDKVCILKLNGNGLSNKNGDGGSVNIQFNTTEDFVPSSYTYSILRSSVVNATARRLGSNIVYQNGGDLEISFTPQNNISEFDFINITSSQPIIKVDNIVASSNSNNNYVNVSCTLVSNDTLSNNREIIQINSVRVYSEFSKTVVIQVSCDDPQINLYTETVINGNITNSTANTTTYRGMDTCNNAKVLIPALSIVTVTCKSTELYYNPSRAVQVDFNIVTTNDFQPMLTSLPSYNIIYEPYKVVLNSVTRSGSKYAGYLNGKLVIRLSPLTGLVGGGNDQIIIESTKYKIFNPPNLTTTSNSSDLVDSYNSCQLKNEVIANNTNETISVYDIANRAIYDQTGLLLTVVVLGTNESIQIDSLSTLILTCSQTRVKNHLCPASVDFNIKTNKDYEIATAYEGNNMYKIEADSECVKLRCGLV
jgi:hypothetical protein